MLLAHQPPLMLKLKRSASGVQRLTAQSSTDSSTNGVSPSGSMVNILINNRILPIDIFTATINRAGCKEECAIHGRIDGTVK